MFGVSTSEGPAIPKLLNIVLLASLCLRNTSLTAGGASKALKKMLTMCYHTSIMSFIERRCCRDSVTQHWASVWYFVLKCLPGWEIMSSFVAVLLVTWLLFSFFCSSPMLRMSFITFSSRASTIMKLTENRYQVQADVVWYFSQSGLVPKLPSFFKQWQVQYIYIYIYVASLYDLTWKVGVTST